MQTMNIAEHVITKIGNGSLADGVRLVCVWLGRSRSRVYCFTYPRARGGTDGVIPAKDQQIILRCARAAGIDLKPEDFFGLTDLPPLGVPANDNAPCGAGDNMAAAPTPSNANRVGDFAPTTMSTSFPIPGEAT